MCEVPGISLISFYSPHVQKTKQNTYTTNSQSRQSFSYFAKHAKENMFQCTVFIMQFFVSFHLIFLLLFFFFLP